MTNFFFSLSVLFFRSLFGEQDIKPGSKVLYLGAASGTTVSHVSDIVGMKGCVYAVEVRVYEAREGAWKCDRLHAETSACHSNKNEIYLSNQFILPLLLFQFSPRPGRDLVALAKTRTNIIPIIEDARRPLKYRMLVGMCDVIFADVAQSGT